VKLPTLYPNERRVLTALGLVVTVLVVGTVGFRVLCPPVADANGNVQPLDWLHSVYMTVISLTTVGYGESVPVAGNPALMVFTSLFLLAGIGVMTYTFGAITAFLIEGALTDTFWKRRMNRRLARMKDHFIVCGAGETSMTAIRELLALDRAFVVVDTEIAALKELVGDSAACVVEGDATDEDVLRQAGIESACGLLASLANDRDNLFLVITARQLNSRIRVVAKVHDLANAPKFRKAGADAVASPQVIGGLRLVSELIRPTVVNFLDVMLRDKDRAIRIDEVQVAEGSRQAGSTLDQLDLRRKFRVQVLGLREAGVQKFDYVPDPDRPIAAGTTLIVLGDAEDVAKLRKAVHVAASAT